MLWEQIGNMTMGGLNLRTLTELATRGAKLEVTCLGCGRVAVFCPRELTQWLGGDADPQRLKFRCTTCRSKRFRWSPTFEVGWRRHRPPSPVK